MFPQNEVRFKPAGFTSEEATGEIRNETKKENEKY
jgi:hypothetical protein